MYNELVSKIDRHDFDFDDNEIFIIRNDKNLYTKVIDYIVENNVIMNKNVYDWFSDFINDGIIPLDPKFIYVYACSAIENCDISYSSFDEVRNYITDETLMDKLAERFLTNLENPQKLNEFCLYKNDLIFLMDNKRYDLIANYDRSFSFSDNSLIQRIKEEFPFDKYGFPVAFFGVKDELKEQFENSSLSTIVSALNDSYDSMYDNDYSDLVYKKIMDDKELDNIDPNLINKLFHAYDNLIPYDKRAEVAEHLMQHDIYFLINTSKEYSANKEQLISHIVERMKVSAVAKNSILELIGNSFLMDLNGFIPIYDELVCQGEYKFINFLPDNIKNKYVDKVIEELKKDKSKFNFDDIPDFIVDNPSAFETIVDLCGESIGQVSLSRVGYIFSPMSSAEEDDLDTKKIDIVIKLLDKNHIVNFQYDSFNFKYDKRLLTKIIEVKNKKMLKEYIYNCLYTTDEKVISQIKNDFVDFAKNDDFFAFVFLDTTGASDFTNYVVNDERMLKVIFDKDFFISKKVLSFINHNEDTVKYTDSIYNVIKKTLCREYNIDINKLDYIVSVVGPEFVRYIENDNVIKLLNSDMDDIKKICELLKTDKFDLRDLEGSFDSLIQYKFSGDNLDVVRTFTNILHSIQDGNEDYLGIIDKMVPYLDANFYAKFSSKYELPVQAFNDPDYLLNFVIEKIKLGDEKASKYTSILREIVSYYINCNRDEYRAKFDMTHDIKIPFELEDNFKKNYLSVYYYISNPSFKIDENSGNYVSFMNLVDEKLVSKGISRELIPYIYQYVLMTSQGLYPNGLIPVSKEIPADVLNAAKSKIGVFKNTCKEVYAEYEKQIDDSWENQVDYLIQRGDEENLIRKKYKFESHLDLANLLKSIRVDILKEKVLSDPDVYKRLYDFIHKKKILDLPDCLKDYIKDQGMDITYDDAYVLAFINYFYSIDEKLRKIAVSNGSDPDKINYNLPLMLKEGRSYGGISGVYSFILGEEDAHLIMSNPGPNAASSKTTNNQRLNEALDLTVRNFLRKDITVPAFNEVLEKDGKSIRCVLGNFTAPENLTLGERTGACMRIGGVGETLFNFALGNENGFHIIFKNPDTGEFVSRVSGFRNGNTVFLNQLRYSCDKTYSNEEVIDFCKIAANKLVEYSKESECPIDNVVISSGYAMSDYDKDAVDLGVSSIKKGLPTFYSDVSERAIVLATSAQDKAFVPVNFDKNKVPHYQPCRRKAIDYTNKNFMGIVQRVHNVKRYIKDKNFDNLEHLDISDDIVMGYANDDWYIYVDENGNIYEEIVGVDLRAENELEEARNLIQEKMNTTGYHM